MTPHFHNLRQEYKRVKELGVLAYVDWLEKCDLTVSYTVEKADRGTRSHVYLKFEDHAAVSVYVNLKGEISVTQEIDICHGNAEVQMCYDGRLSVEFLFRADYGEAVLITEDRLTQMLEKLNEIKKVNGVALG